MTELNDLVFNLALLIALAALYQVVISRLQLHAIATWILFGALFGLAAVLAMMAPIVVAPGLIFDGRSVILSISGLVGGPVMALISGAIAAAYRIWLGGPGAVVGVAVIASSAAIGAGFHYRRRRTGGRLTILQLYGFGLLVHVVMLVLFLFLPDGTGVQIVRNLGPYFMLAYPLTTMAIGLLFQDYEEQQRTRARLHELAYFDRLTGLPNRICLIERLERLLAAPEGGRQGLLLLINLDRFKTINEARGHSSGDALLAGDRRTHRGAPGPRGHPRPHGQRRIFGARPAERTGVIDGGQRHGTHRKPDGSHPPAAGHRSPDHHHHRKHRRHPVPARWRRRGRRHSPAGRYGPASGQAAGRQPDGLLRGTDVRRRRAPLRHRARSAQRHRQRRTAAVPAGASPGLRHARRRRGADPVAAPDARSGGACRLHSDRRGQRSHRRHRYLGVHGGLSPAGRYRARGHAFATVHQHQPASFPSSRLRAVDHRHPACDRGGPAPHHAGDHRGPADREPGRGRHEVHALADIGVRFSVDDFGTGYSSINYLRHLPIHEIKINRSFVLDAPGDPTDATLVDTILAVAERLSLDVVAEGIETDRHAAFFRQRGDVIHQGYFHGRPEPAAQWLQRWGERAERRAGGWRRHGVTHSDAGLLYRRGALPMLDLRTTDAAHSNRS